jgi:hypothetical protein
MDPPRVLQARKRVIALICGHGQSNVRPGTERQSTIPRPQEGEIEAMARDIEACKKPCGKRMEAS